MTRRIHQIQYVSLTILGLLTQPYCLGLNLDAALILNFH